MTWREPLARGVLAIVVSAVFLIFPRTTASVIAFGFGIYAFWDGIFALMHALRNPPPDGLWSTLIVAGSAEIVIGIVALVLSSATAATIGTFIAYSGIIAGSLGVVAAFRGRNVPRENTLVVSGAFTAIVGLVLLFVPLAVIVAQIWTVAAYGVFLGLHSFVYALRLRRRPSARA